MKKIVVRALSIMSVLAFAATVAAAEAPRDDAKDAKDENAPTLSCTKSGMTCGSSSQCCSKSCAKSGSHIVGRCN